MNMNLPLRDIHLPEAISWWPLAVGWWIVIGGFFILLLAASLFFWRLLKPNLRKEAATTLVSIESAFQLHDDPHLCLSELSKFLRRAAISQKGVPQKIGSLTGEAWLEVLDRPLKKPAFSQGVGRILLTGPYSPQADKEQVIALIQLCHQWVKTL